MCIRDRAKKAAILRSPRWRRAVFELGDWLDSQEIYPPKQVMKIKSDFNRRVAGMSSYELEYLLEDLDEHRNWLKRPVGETVAMLCKSLGLSPEACIQRDGQWLVRRTPTTYETLREKGPSCLPKSPRPSGPDGRGRQYGLGADVDETRPKPHPLN